MPSHRFRVGQTVEVSSSGHSTALAPHGLHRIVRLMPRDPQYVVHTVTDGYDRLVLESQISLSEPPPTEQPPSQEQAIPHTPAPRDAPHSAQRRRGSGLTTRPLGGTTGLLERRSRAGALGGRTDHASLAGPHYDGGGSRGGHLLLIWLPRLLRMVPELQAHAPLVGFPQTGNSWPRARLGPALRRPSSSFILVSEPESSP